MRRRVLIDPCPPPDDRVTDGGGIVPEGESFAEWARVQDAAGRHWTVVSDDTPPAGPRVVVLGRYAPGGGSGAP